MLRRIGAVAAVAVGLALASTATNLALEQHERVTVKPYGQRIPVAGGEMNVYEHGHGDTTIVLLSPRPGRAPG